MSSIEKYNGDFVNYIYQTFDNKNPSKTLHFNNIRELDLTLSCDVIIVPSETTFVEIFAAEDPKIECYQQQDTLIIKQEEVAENNISINGRSITVSGGANTMIVNGRVFVNGIEIDPNQPTKKQKPIKIIVYIPHYVDLIAQMSGSSILASKTLFNKTKISMIGQSTVGLASKSLKVQLSGVGRSYCLLTGGDLKLDLSGQGNLRIKGEWADADVSVSGMGNIQTEGTCNGDYDADVSGMGRISHQGHIAGRKRQSKSGMGSISI